MKSKWTYFLLCLTVLCGYPGLSRAQVVDIYKEPFVIPEFHLSVPQFNLKPEPQSISDYTDLVIESELYAVAQKLNLYKAKNRLSDWMFYQVVRRTANFIFPKKENYESYTVMKWYLLYSAGYDVRLAIVDGNLLFYAYSTEEVEDIPYFELEGKRYYCLNRHDFGAIDFTRHMMYSVPRPVQKLTLLPFSYKIHQLPDFVADQFSNKVIEFRYDGRLYQFEIPVNNSLDTLFTNYPVVNYDMYFNIPLSEHTYQTLIPQLKEAVAGKDTLNGVAYLMKFARDAFAYENDIVTYAGKEKRFSPEQTLIADKSDCDDRVGLLHLLIREIYNLPMIVVQFPTHVILGVQLEKPGGDYVSYKGQQYLVCEPTPQRQDFPIGKMDEKYKTQQYQVAYSYFP